MVVKKEAGKYGFDLNKFRCPRCKLFFYEKNINYTYNCGECGTRLELVGKVEHQA